MAETFTAIVMAFLVMLIVGIIGFMIAVPLISDAEKRIDCNILDNPGRDICQKQKDNSISTAWTVLAIMPIGMFITIFLILRGSGESESVKTPEDNTTNEVTKNSNSSSGGGYSWREYMPHMILNRAKNDPRYKPAELPTVEEFAPPEMDEL